MGASSKFTTRTMAVKALQEIGSQLRRAVHVDEAGLQNMDKRIFFVLVEIDFRKGLIP